jgi:carnitine O-acetyltransferase
VACQGQFYKVEFVNDQGDPLPLSILEQRLNQCVDMATQQCQYPQMGWLTSVHRDIWTKTRQELLDKGGSAMKNALETMESGAFCLNVKVNDQPTTMTDAANVFWKDGNRWMDKSLQLVCTANGKMAYIGEHSMLDAAPVIPLIKRIIKTTYHRLSSKQAQGEDELTSTLEANDDNGGVVNVFEECWKSPELTETAAKLTTLAKQQYQQLAAEYECKVLEFTGYGKKLIKGAGFVCHDLVQQALQLAAYRYFGHQVGTYEAALTRIFLHGRTETARPVSPQSKAFVECMGMERNDDKSREEKLALLKQAAAVHDEYQNAACNGQGVDRHFFGLSNMVQEGEAVPALFSDPLFIASKNWKLSTSSVIFTPGFGPSTEDGVAIGYRVEANQCTFTCTSRSDNHAVEPFLQILEQVLTEIGELLREE